jgi:hypothetical protein
MPQLKHLKLFLKNPVIFILWNPSSHFRAHTGLSNGSRSVTFRNEGLLTFGSPCTATLYRWSMTAYSITTLRNCIIVRLLHSQTENSQCCSDKQLNQGSRKLNYVYYLLKFAHVPFIQSTASGRRPTCIRETTHRHNSSISLKLSWKQN